MSSDILDWTHRSHHAAQRCQQRAIPEVGIELVQRFGVSRPAGDGALSYSFDKAAWRKVQAYLGPWPLKTMDRLKRLYIIVADTGTIVTAAYR